MSNSAKHFWEEKMIILCLKKHQVVVIDKRKKLQAAIIDKQASGRCNGQQKKPQVA